MGRRKEAKPVLRKHYDPKRPEYKFRVYFSKPDGTRTSSVFRTKQEASNFVEVKHAEVHNLGSEIAATIDDDLKRRLFNAIKVLESYGKTLEDAVTHYVEYLQATERSMPIVELYEDFLGDMERARKSDRYIADLRNRLIKFVEDFGETYASALTTRDAQAWLNRLKVGDVTRNHYRRVLSAFFAWCERQGYAQTNPIAKTTKAKAVGGECKIFTVEEMRHVLDLACQFEEKDILAMVCLGGFAGLRASEIERLRWQEVNIREGFIDLKKGKTKTAARRIVDMKPVLKQWLQKYFKGASGPIQRVNYPNRLKLFRDMLKRGDKTNNRPPIAWPHNGLRHSYASYLLAETKDPGMVSLQLGHGDAGVLFAHYREIVTIYQSKAYWNLIPKA